MKIVLIVTFFVSIVLESTLIPFPLTLLTLLFFGALIGERKAIWAFILGLLLDLFSGRVLGTTSLFFLGVVFISYRYRKKLYPANLYYQIFFLILVLSLYNFLFYKYLDFRKLLLVAVGAALALKALGKFFPQMGEKIIVE